MPNQLDVPDVMQLIAKLTVEFVRAKIKEEISDALNQETVARTRKALEKISRPIGTVTGGVVAENESGQYDASLDTDIGPVVLRNATRTDRPTDDPQALRARSENNRCPLTPHDVLLRLEATPTPAPEVICAAEFVKFPQSSQPAILGHLWRYIISNRDRNQPDVLTAVCSAMRKYIALLPMDRMGELAALFEPSHRVTLSLDLELEIAKMVYRNFEVHPPVEENALPDLAEKFMERVRLYTSPVLLNRDKHAAAASTLIAAIISLRSSLWREAMSAANGVPFKWFPELVADDVQRLKSAWSGRNPDAAGWLSQVIEMAVVS